MKNFLLFFLILLLFHSCDSDSTNKSTSDNYYVNLEHFKNLNNSDKISYLDSLTQQLENKENDSVLRKQYFEIADEYFYINEILKSKKIGFKMLEFSIQEVDSISMAKALFYIGDSYMFSQKDSAYYYYFQAEKIYDIKHDVVNVARMQYNKAYVLFYDGNYIASEVQLSKALQNLKNSDDYFLIYSTNSLMGICLEKIGDFDEALIYHNNALKIIPKLDLSAAEKDVYKVSSTTNIANLYDIKHEYDKSIISLEGVLTDDLKKNNPLSYARVLSNLANSKFKNGDFYGVQAMFLESIKIADNLGQDSDLLYKYIYFGEFYTAQQDTVLAIHYLKKAHNIAVKNNNTNELLCTLKLLSKIDRKNSLRHSAKYIEISDSVNLLQKKTRNKYARIEYETTRIEDANKTLSRNNIIIIIAAIILITLLIGFIVFRYIKYKNKELQFLRRQEKASEDIFQLLSEQQQKIDQAKDREKTKIAQELHDGVVNSLYGIRLNLSFFNTKYDPASVEKRNSFMEELKKVESEIRTISHDLSRNTFFDSSNFNLLLSGLIDNQKEISKTRFSYNNTGGFDWSVVPNLCKINLYRIIQEAILNVNKYGQAQNCFISIQYTDKKQIRVLIQDDGVGFDTKSKKTGIGHTNMKDRVDLLDGEIFITSDIGKGTTIEILVDINFMEKKGQRNR